MGNRAPLAFSKIVTLGGTLSPSLGKTPQMRVLFRSHTSHSLPKGKCFPDPHTVSLDFRVVKTRELPDQFQPPPKRSSDGVKTAGESVTEDSDRNRAPRRPQQRSSTGASQSNQAASPRLRNCPAPLQNLLDDVADGLTEAELRAFLGRIVADPDKSLRDRSRSRTEWRELLISWLEEEADQFMAVAEGLRET